VSDTKLIVPSVEVAQRSDPGRDPDKQVNEDTCRCGETPIGFLAVLCDGMGGHEGGREASTLAVDSIFRHVMTAAPRPDIPPPARARELLHEAIVVANQQVYGMSTAHGAARPGSTVVAALVHPYGTDVAHVGDSRCYLVQDGHIRQVTRDHSMVQQMVDAGVLTAEQAVGHPDANMITRALGMGESVEVELQTHPVAHRPGDTFILCSDGLSDLVEEAEILRIVAARPAVDSVTELVDLANARGGHDNITVVVVRAREAALGPLGSSAAPMTMHETQPMPAVEGGALPPPAPPSNRTLVSNDFAPGPAPASGGPRDLAPASGGPRGLARRRTSPLVVVGAVLGFVALAAGVFVAVLKLAPRKDTNSVPDASDAALIPSIVLPSASLTQHLEGPDADIPDVVPAVVVVPDAAAPPRRNKSRPHK
jgi:serine/threonine protein phosphatase PrpC